MQQYRIKGANKVTGFDVSTTVRASSAEDASRIAAAGGVLVESAVLVEPEGSLAYEARPSKSPAPSSSTPSSSTPGAVPSADPVLPPPAFPHPSYAGLVTIAHLLTAAAVLMAIVSAVTLLVGLRTAMTGQPGGTELLFVSVACLFSALLYVAGSSAVKAFRDIAINSFAWRQSAPTPPAPTSAG